MLNTTIVNLFGGPGSGKSTIAAALFAATAGRCSRELVTEAAKDRVWDGADLDNEIALFGEQHGRIARLVGKVDLVITDSPILLPPVYAAYYRHECASLTFTQLAIDEFRRLAPSLNYFVERPATYDAIGRAETAASARDLDSRILEALHGHGVEFESLEASRTIDERARYVLSDLVFAGVVENS